MKTVIASLLALAVLTSPVYGQFMDDFSDGNLDGWEGDVSNFVVNPDHEMQLNAPTGSTVSWIHTPVVFADSMLWDLYVKLDFAPSTSNQLKIYLGLTSADPVSGDGYFLEIGASGDQDALELKYTSGGIESPIAASIPALVANQPVVLHLRVKRNLSGLWTVYNTSSITPEILLSGTDTRTPVSSLTTFGFYARYTDTRRDKFFFDDIHIRAPQPDVQPPSWLSLTVSDQHSVELTFDELLDNATAEMVSHYILMPGNITPASSAVNANKIVLTWNESFVNQLTYTLMVSDLIDLAGNAMTSTSKSFSFFQIDHALSYELLITEIMADPTPLIGLPNAEFIEIFNPSQKTFLLSDYTLKAGSSQRALPGDTLWPGMYIILTDADDAALFTGLGRVAAVTNMPSLTNTGMTLSLLSGTSEIIHEVTYSDEWYQDPQKADGGWTLEMLNPFDVCLAGENWKASNDLSGGTPGRENSQWNPNPYLPGISLLSAYALTPSSVELRFSGQVDPVLMENPANYQIQPGINIAGASVTSSSVVTLVLTDPLENGISYRLLPFEIWDCQGRQNYQGDTIEFGLIVDAGPGDLLINEVLFNPATGGSRFIEVINPGQTYINLQTLAIARLSPSDQDIYLTDIRDVLGPGELAVFTPSPADIKARYSVPHPDKVYMSSVPAWDDKQDNVSLLVAGTVIDSFTYSSDWHHPSLADQNGVSLERLSTETETTLASNWQSTSSLAGYATPTGTNSHTIHAAPEGDSPFVLENSVFSPNEDGFKDFLAIQFTETNPEDVASAWIYDLAGREIYTLLSNELIDTYSLVTWDGRNNEGRLAEMGMYVLFVRIWRPDGTVRSWKRTCALVKR